jgi:glycosyltransferase involved in cell wall biosynthesis
MRVALEEPMHGAGRGGVSTYVRNLIRELPKADPEGDYFVFAYFFRDYERKLALLPDPAGEGFERLVPRWPESLVDKIEWNLGIPVLKPFLEAKKIDLFHAHRIPRRKPKRCVATIHDLFPVVHPDWTSDFLIDQYDRILKPGIERVDRVIAVSEHTKKDLMEHWRVPEEKIAVTHEGVDRDLFRPLPEAEKKRLREKLGLPERFVLMIGPFDPWCHPGNVPRALARLPEPLWDVGLVFAGKGGQTRKEVERIVLEEGLVDRTVWTGYVPQPELVGLYNLAEALVYPSFYEGFGLPVLEAMSCGTPVVTANTSSLPEVAGDAAILVDPADVDALADAIRRAIDEPSERETLIRKGLERAERMSWAETARKTLDVYRSVS